MRLKEIVLAVSLASCAGAPKTTHTPGVDGIVGNLPETDCPANFTQHVEQVGEIERIAVRACLGNDITDLKAHCKEAFSKNGRYAGEPIAIKRKEVLMWNCQGMAAQSVGSGLASTELKNRLATQSVSSGLKGQEVKQTPPLPKAQPIETPTTPTR